MQGDVAPPAGSPFVQEGGPEKVSEHSDRSLLLVWPDYNGTGSYGMRCLESYKGSTLLLVGEWKGRAMTGPHGQSFSMEFQEAVEAGWDVVEQIRLPSWPLFLDGLTVWSRKKATKSSKR